MPATTTQRRKVEKVSPHELLSRFAPEELAAVAADLAQLVAELSRKGKRRNVKFSQPCYVEADVFSDEIPAFLQLLAPLAQPEMTRQHFLGELLTVIFLRNPVSLFHGAYVYSITVTDPPKMYEHCSPEIWKSVPAVHQAQVRVGYLHHELLYGLSSRADLQNLLSQVLELSNEIEVSLKPSASAFAAKKKISFPKRP